MFLILEWGEYDSQSSRKAWEVVYPYLEDGYKTHRDAESAVAPLRGGCGRIFRIVEVK